MSYLVIVEGIDRVGKTTLCEELAKRGFTYFKDSFITEDMAQNNRDFSYGKLDTTVNLLKKLYDDDHNIVVDRFFLTEYAYHPGVIASFMLYRFTNIIREMFPRLAYVNMLPTDEKEAFERSGVNQANQLARFADGFAPIKQATLVLDSDYRKISHTVQELMLHTYSYDIYFASPFFNPEQLEREQRLVVKLRQAGYRVFAPRENGILKPDASDEERDFIFQENVKAIRNSRGIFAVTDGKDIGTIWEAGYGSALNKPIIYYAETLGDRQFNIMLANSSNLVITSKNFPCGIIERALNGEKEKYGGKIQ